METLEQRAVARCIDEAGRAILYGRALAGLEAADSYHGVDFIQLAYWALFDQMIAHSIKVLVTRERHGFWYLVKRHKQMVHELCVYNGLSLKAIKDIDGSLLHIRDKTHFHLDKAGVKNPKKIWRDAKLKRSDLKQALEIAFVILAALHAEIRNVDYYLPPYDASDAKAIAEHASQNDLVASNSGEPETLIDLRP